MTDNMLNNILVLAGVHIEQRKGKKPTAYYKGSRAEVQALLAVLIAGILENKEDDISLFIEEMKEQAVSIYEDMKPLGGLDLFGELRGTHRLPW